MVKGYLEIIEEAVPSEDSSRFISLRNLPLLPEEQHELACARPSPYEAQACGCANYRCSFLARRPQLCQCWVVGYFRFETAGDRGIPTIRNGFSLPAAKSRGCDGL